MKKRTMLTELSPGVRSLSSCQLDMIFGGLLISPRGKVDTGTLNGLGDPDHLTDERL